MEWKLNLHYAPSTPFTAYPARNAIHLALVIFYVQVADKDPLQERAAQADRETLKSKPMSKFQHRAKGKVWLL